MQDTALFLFISTDYFLADFLPTFAKASPKISPNEAPAFVAPNSSIAAFSSATSRALMDNVNLRVLASKAVTLASTFSPMAKRSVFCSERSFAKSVRLMKPLIPLTSTSIPPSSMAETIPVTISPFLMLSEAVANGSSVNCLIPKEIRYFSTSISKILALTTIPFL